MFNEDINTEQGLKYINNVLSHCIKKTGIKCKNNSTEHIAKVQIHNTSANYIRKVQKFNFVSFLTQEDATNYLVIHIIDALADLVNYTLINNKNQTKFCFFSSDNIPLSEEDASILVLSNISHSIVDELEQVFHFSFENVDMLSLMKHEGEKSRGNLLFLCIDNVNMDELECKCIWTATNCLPLFSGEYIRYIRKLLAGAEDAGLLFVFGKDNQTPYFYGVVEKEIFNEFPLRIKIWDTLKWNIMLFDTPVFTSTFNGFIACHDDELSVLEDAIKREFKKETIPKEFMDLLIRIKKQKHGSSVIIVDLSYHDKQIDTLKNRLENLENHDKSIKINKSKFNIKNNSITNAAKMDGTIIVDLSEYKIKYLATIVDGLSKVKGDSSRGARYNSIKNFTYDIANCNIPIVSAVFSEDGGEDIFEGSKLKNIL